MTDLNKSAVDNFNFFAEAYADRFSEMGAFKDAISVLCGDLSPDSSILELGCGPGNFAKHLLDVNSTFQITGVDMAPKMIELARAKVPTGQFLIQDVRSYEPKQKFDAVVLSFCTPYLNRSEFEELIQKSANLLTFNGKIYLSTMEGNYEDSQFIASSSNPSKKSFTYYYPTDYVLDLFKKYNLFPIYNEIIPIPENTTPASGDLVLIGRIIT